MLTEAEWEGMPDDFKIPIVNRVEQMTPEQALTRCKQLSKKLTIPSDPFTSPDPEPADMQEHYEYFLLKRRLGKC